MFSYGGEVSSNEPQREFYLVDHVTTIGSAPDADLRLAGLLPAHAEIRHDEDDDYTYIPLGPASGGSVDGRPHVDTMLRTGTRIKLGPWTLSFYREEFADKSVGVDTLPGIRFAQMRDDPRAAEIASHVERE